MVLFLIGLYACNYNAFLSRLFGENTEIIVEINKRPEKWRDLDRLNENDIKKNEQNCQQHEQM